MKKILFVIITCLFTASCISSQNAKYFKGKEYEGYIFVKEHPIWGFPPENGRYTPSREDIAQAEKILQDSINTDYVKQNQKQYRKPPINKETLKNYVRQYVGYLTDKNEIVIWINLSKKGIIKDQDFSCDIISVQGGEEDFWDIRINIMTKDISDMHVNGKS